VPERGLVVVFRSELSVIDSTQKAVRIVSPTVEIACNEHANEEMSCIRTQAEAGSIQ